MAVEPVTGVVIRPPVPAVRRVTRRTKSEETQGTAERPARRRRAPGLEPGLGENLDVTV